MNGSDRNPRKVVIVGGGITGLAAAHRLIDERERLDRPIGVTLLEASDRVGGSIRTERHDGFVIEHGPDMILSAKPQAIDLSRRLGIEDQIISTNTEHRRTFVVRGGRLHPLPDGFQLIAPTQFWPFLRSPLFSFAGKLRMGMDLVIPPRRDHGDESVASFIRRRMGEEALRWIAQPMIAGIYTADPEQLSLQATMPQLVEMEQKHGGLIAGMLATLPDVSSDQQNAGPRYGAFVSFEQGLQTLVEALTRRLEGVIRAASPVQHLIREDCGWRLCLADGSSIAADAVVLALPAPPGARLMEPIGPELSQQLSEITCASSVVINFAFRRADVPHPLDGFGFIVPAAEARPLLACTFSSVKFFGRAPDGHVLLRCFAGGALRPELCELEEDALIATCREQLRDLLGIASPPLFTRVSYHRQSMPQYFVGHREKVARIREIVRRWPGLQLAGSAFEGVGIPDCIRSGEEAAGRILDS